MDPVDTIIEIGGTSYAIGRLSPKKAFHVARRLAPFLGAILPHFQELVSPGADGRKATPQEFAARSFDLFPQIADVIAKMSDTDADFILDTCLEAVKMRQQTGWAPLIQGGVLMFENLDLKTMLQLTGEVVKVNMADFFPSSQPEASGATVPATAVMQ
jgi:hypothetical protein